MIRKRYIDIHGHLVMITEICIDVCSSYLSGSYSVDNGGRTGYAVSSCIGSGNLIDYG